MPNDISLHWKEGKTMMRLRSTDCWLPISLFLSIALCEPQEFALIKKLRFISGKPLGLKYCVCGPIYMPVCGSDERTYPNICTAMCKVTVSNFFLISSLQSDYKKKNFVLVFWLLNDSWWQLLMLLVILINIWFW